jgi:hypothetical protein
MNLPNIPSNFGIGILGFDDSSHFWHPRQLAICQ